MSTDNRRRRSFSPGFKLRVVAEYETCPSDAERKDILRRESLTRAQIEWWRNEALSVLTDRRRSAIGEKRNQDRNDVKLHSENERLQNELAMHNRAAMEAVGMASAIVEVLSKVRA
ncbi:hypothetical protein [Streptomonospora wellingtoniae]|uniref:Transposase n=1 Tax=Streptomonospora wellingtoniae TaxID=3075544 RepID=A0ABU2KND7_9ACTN|nr:hypothetical protein [Streptomonospora sp. DSM 45055]MDT0300712.1 hypothetical protein [Streptomonospora sp. DSM 45055]